MDPNQIYYGTLTKWYATRNFGFIRDDISGVDSFVHISGFAGKLALPQGSRVYYRLAPNVRRANELLAVDVRLIPAPISDEVRQ